MGKLDEFFFSHLANITFLSIKAPKEGQLKLPGEDYVPLALKADQMPLLANLHLDDFFASTELIDFLVGHKDTLEEIILCNCYASVTNYAKNGIYWYQFFNSLFSAYPAQLRHLELVGGSMCLPNQKIFIEKRYEESCTIHQQDPERIIFPYATLTDEYGD